MVFRTLLMAVVVFVAVSTVDGNVDLWHFIKSIPEDAKVEMRSIINNSALTKAQMMNMLDQWAAKQSADFQEEYQQVKQLIAQRKNPVQTRAADPAQGAIADEVESIRSNKSLTREQERAAVLKVLTPSPDLTKPPSSSSTATPSR